MMGRVGHHFLANDRAAAAAEMALIVPMALVLIFTTMEAGYYFQTEHKAIKYVREGSRYAARQNFSFFDCSGAGAFDASATNVVTQIQNVTLTGRVSGGSARIADWNAGDIAVSVSCDDSFGTGLYAETDDGKAPVVLVATRFAYQPIVGRLGFDVSNIDVVAQAEAPVVGL